MKQYNDQQASTNSALIPPGTNYHGINAMQSREYFQIQNQRVNLAFKTRGQSQLCQDPILQCNCTYSIYPSIAHQIHERYNQLTDNWMVYAREPSGLQEQLLQVNSPIENMARLKEGNQHTIQLGESISEIELYSEKRGANSANQALFIKNQKNRLEEMTMQQALGNDTLLSPATTNPKRDILMYSFSIREDLQDQLENINPGTIAQDYKVAYENSSQQNAAQMRQGDFQSWPNSKLTPAKQRRSIVHGSFIMS